VNCWSEIESLLASWYGITAALIRVCLSCRTGALVWIPNMGGCPTTGTRPGTELNWARGGIRPATVHVYLWSLWQSRLESGGFHFTGVPLLPERFRNGTLWPATVRTGWVADGLPHGLTPNACGGFQPRLAVLVAAKGINPHPGRSGPRGRVAEPADTPRPPFASSPATGSTRQATHQAAWHRTTLHPVRGELRGESGRIAQRQPNSRANSKA
jgi:hypothetical protein